MKFIINFFLIILITNTIYSQNHQCGDELYDLGGNNLIDKEISKRLSDCDDVNSFPSFYQIPVAIHVIPDEIEVEAFPPDDFVAQFYIDEANEFLSPYFELIPVETCSGITFRPEQKVTQVSDANVAEVMSWSRLDSERYLNIYIVRDAGINGNFQFVDAFSWNPARNSNIDPDRDGIVIEKGSSVALGETLAHEVGHYFGLWHLWGPELEDPSNCGNDPCLSGDQVADTEPFLGWYWFDDPCAFIPSDEHRSIISCEQNLENVDCHNIMSWPTAGAITIINREGFSEGQFHRMIRFKNTLRPKLGSQNGDQSILEISENSIIEYDLAVNSLVIKSGATVRIKDSQVIVNPEGNIFLEKGSRLILQNAEIKGCGDQWDGIFMASGNIPNTLWGELDLNNAPILIIQENSRISDSKFGATNVFDPDICSGYNLLCSNANGVILATDSYFSNNDHGVYLSGQHNSKTTITSC